MSSCWKAFWRSLLLNSAFHESSCSLHSSKKSSEPEMPLSKSISAASFSASGEQPLTHAPDSSSALLCTRLPATSRHMSPKMAAMTCPLSCWCMTMLWSHLILLAAKLSSVGMILHRCWNSKLVTATGCVGGRSRWWHSRSCSPALAATNMPCPAPGSEGAWLPGCQCEVPEWPKWAGPLAHSLLQR